MMETVGVTGAGREDCVLSVVPAHVKAKKGTKAVTTYAFLDPGNSAAFATESLINQLNVNGHNTSIVLRTMGNEAVVNTCVVKGLEISSLDGELFLKFQRHIHRTPSLQPRIIFPAKRISSLGLT